MVANENKRFSMIVYMLDNHYRTMAAVSEPMREPHGAFGAQGNLIAMVGGKNRVDAFCTGPKSIRRDESRKGEIQEAPISANFLQILSCSDFPITIGVYLDSPDGTCRLALEQSRRFLRAPSSFRCSCSLPTEVGTGDVNSVV
jgi:hypothetical protein